MFPWRQGEESDSRKQQRDGAGHDQCLIMGSLEKFRQNVGKLGGVEAHKKNFQPFHFSLDIRHGFRVAGCRFHLRKLDDGRVYCAKCVQDFVHSARFRESAQNLIVRRSKLIFEESDAAEQVLAFAQQFVGKLYGSARFRIILGSLRNLVFRHVVEVDFGILRKLNQRFEAGFQNLIRP